MKQNTNDASIDDAALFIGVLESLPSPAASYLNYKRKIDIKNADATYTKDIAVSDILIAMLIAEIKSPEEQNPLLKLLQEYTLEDKFWQLMKENYGYSHESPSLKNFLLYLVQSGSNELTEVLIVLFTAELINDENCSPRHLNPVLQFINAANLKCKFWYWVQQYYHYNMYNLSKKVDSLNDIQCFLYCLFAYNCNELSFIQNTPLANIAMQDLSDNAKKLLHRWQNNCSGINSYIQWSRLMVSNANINGQCNKLSLDFFKNSKVDIFEIFEEQLFTLLVNALKHGELSKHQLDKIIESRKDTFWYNQSGYTSEPIYNYKKIKNQCKDYRSMYECLRLALEFNELYTEFRNYPDKKLFDDAEDAVKKYIEHWYKLDQLYRQFVSYTATLNYDFTPLTELQNLIEQYYVKEFLPSISNLWHEQVDKLSKWKIPGISSQSNFHHEFIVPLLNSDKQTCIIVSDALRYEIGEEMTRFLNSSFDNKYKVKLTSLLSVLPSCTPLGKAALLPHTTLKLWTCYNCHQRDSQYNIYIDQLKLWKLPAKDTIEYYCVEKFIKPGVDHHSNFIRCLAHNSDYSSISSEYFLARACSNSQLPGISPRVMYIWHNIIDYVGHTKDDKKLIEVFKSELVFKEIHKIINALESYGFTHIFITSDHGFLYQHSELSDDELLPSNLCPQDNRSIFVNSNDRFWLGEKFPSDNKYYTAYNANCFLGLCEGSKLANLQVLIPRGYKRFKTNTNLRYTHGGSSLQEVIVPLIEITTECDKPYTSPQEK